MTKSHSLARVWTHWAAVLLCAVCASMAASNTHAQGGDPGVRGGVDARQSGAIRTTLGILDADWSHCTVKSIEMPWSNGAATTQRTPRPCRKPQSTCKRFVPRAIGGWPSWDTVLEAMPPWPIWPRG